MREFTNLNELQRRELSKFLFDMAKLSATGIALSKAFTKDFNFIVFALGVVFSIICCAIGTLLLTKIETERRS